MGEYGKSFRQDIEKSREERQKYNEKKNKKLNGKKVEKQGKLEF